MSSSSPSPPPSPQLVQVPCADSQGHQRTVQRVNRQSCTPPAIEGIAWKVREHKIPNQDQKTRWIFHEVPAPDEVHDPPPPPQTLVLYHGDIFISHCLNDRTTTGWMWTVTGEEQGWTRVEKGNPCPYDTCFGYVLNWSRHGKPAWVKQETQSRVKRVQKELLEM